MGAVEDARKELRRLADKEKAKILAGFFRTGPGEYGEGDVFLGVTVPKSRSVAKKFSSMNFQGIKRLLGSKIHEERLVALLILVEKFKRAPMGAQNEIVGFYTSNLQGVNNWDLVDLSADKILGEHLLGMDKKILRKFAVSENLWERRIAIVSTFAFIKRKRLEETFAIAELLLGDRHDLIHKAVGWMLREAGKRDQNRLEGFLRENHAEMPRTMLRYAIEKFPERKRKAFLEGIA
ncbi:MAG: DNA alkylation repair protein [Candidatus Diapherotrites archaeon]|nr:DNA alkylation repair protein [Candidatus Diapherotrites archaeon]